MDEESYVESKWGEECDIFAPTKEEMTTVDCVVNAAAIESGIEPSTIVGRCRVPDIVDVRFIVYDICKKNGYFTLSKLGRMFGRNHGTIINGLKRTEERMQGKETAFKRFRELHARINRKYKQYEDNPERMVQELGLYDGRQGDDLPPKA